MSPNRVVAVLTPLVFAPAAGAVTAWLAENFPGVEVSQSALEEIFIVGALIALAPAVQWLNGWQKHEARQAEAQQAIEIANAAPPTLVAVEPIEDEEEALFDELDDLDELEELEELDEVLGPDDGEPVRTGG
ncbi:MAG: hypothetical protein ACRDLA_04905 [Thermoleophilaceae bacterium]